jgi:hypothetical protein
VRCGRVPLWCTLTLLSHQTKCPLHPDAKASPSPSTISKGGAQGQGRISIETKETDRIQELMRVRPRLARQYPRSIVRNQFPGITVKLGRPKL